MSVVTNAGPRGQKLSKVFPSIHWFPLRSICQSRALTSLATVKPATWDRASSSWTAKTENLQHSDSGENQVRGDAAHLDVFSSSSDDKRQLHLPVHLLQREEANCTSIYLRQTTRYFVWICLTLLQIQTCRHFKYEETQIKNIVSFHNVKI